MPSDIGVEETEPKIAIKTRHPSGENNQEMSRVVESKRRSFIVSRVVEHNVIQDKIQEVETEGAVCAESTHSPENTQITAVSGSVMHVQSQQSDIDASTMSDSERSMKSIGKPKVPVNINDLNDKLAKLTGGTMGGNIGQLEVAAAGTNIQSVIYPVDTHSPVPLEENGPSQPQGTQHQPAAHQPQPPPHQSSVEKPADQSTPQQQPQQQQQSIDKAQHPAQTQIQQQTATTPSLQQTPMPVSGQPQQSTQPASQAIPQQQVSSQPLPAHSTGQPTTHQHITQTTQQQPQVLQQGPTQPVQSQGSQDIPSTSMPSVYPQAGMSYFPVMQPFGYPHQHGSGMVQMYSDPMHYMNLQFGNYQNPMVPYVMVNVQQQHQVGPMLVPANMIMPNQMPFMNAQSSSHPQHAHPDGHGGESLITTTPPGTPPHSRKQHSTEAQSESGAQSSDVQSPAPPRSNYSLASLEQDLIKKLHGNRKDIPLSSGGGVLNESVSQSSSDLAARLQEDRPLWTQSSESLHSELADQLDGFLKAESSSEHQIKTEPSNNSVKDSSVTPKVKKLRFQVSRVENDPLIQDDTADTNIDQTDSKDCDQINDSNINEQTHMNNGSSDTETTNITHGVTDKPTVSIAAKLGRFSVTKVNSETETMKRHDYENKSIVINSGTVDEINGASVDDKLAEVVIHAPGTDLVVDGAYDGPYEASAGLAYEQEVTSVSKLHDLPYRKKSMSFFEGNNSPALSNNTCDSFYNTHMDRFQIFSRRRTKSLGSMPLQANLSESSQSISMQTQCTQYGDGETPSPSPSSVDVDRGFPNVVFDLLSSRDEEGSCSTDSESKNGRESGIDSEPPEQCIRRPRLRRQMRKVSIPMQ